MADESTENSDVDGGLLDPQISLSDELLLDQEDLGEDQPSVRKSTEEIPNIEEDDPVRHWEWIFLWFSMRVYDNAK